MSEAELKELLENYFSTSSLEDCFVVDIQIKLPLIRVYVDSDTTLGFDKCTKISRFLEAHFDDSKYFGEKYTLEVSSPGIGSPLQFKRQYYKNIGRKVEVFRKDNEKALSGMLKEVNDLGVVLEVDKIEKQGKKKKKIKELVPIEDQEIDKVIVKISFK